MTEPIRPGEPSEPIVGATEADTETAGGHLGDLIAAYVDGQVTPEERARVEAHASWCDVCRLQLAAEGRLSQLVRLLPIVSPPFGFIERVQRHGPVTRQRAARRVRFGMANVVGTAAALVLVLGVATSNRTAAVSPQVRESVVAHADAEAVVQTSPERGLGSPMSSVGVFHMGPAPQLAERAAAYGLPSVFGKDFVLAAFGERPWAAQAVYSDGVHDLSVFVQQGSLNWDDLPEQAEPVLVGGRPAWHLVDGSRDILIVPRGAVVYTIVGPVPDDQLRLVGSAVPDRAEPGDSLIDRLADAGRGLLSAFALRG